MRNKVSNSLFKRGLISFAAAGLLTTGAMAADGVVNSTTASFDAMIDSTSVAKGNCVYLTLNLLNENGVIDTLNGGNVDTVSLTVTSLLGTVDNGFLSYTKATSTTDDNIFAKTTTASDFTNGVAKASICYTDKIGTDTISVIGYIKDLDTDIKNLNTQKMDVTVSQSVNQGNYLVIESAAPVNTVQGQTAGTYYYQYDGTGGEQDGVFYAGEPFNINIKAKIYNSSTTAVTDASNQEGTVTLKFYRDDNASAGTPYQTLTAEMVNGLATVKVPADTMTLADSYYMIASMDTGVKTVSGDYVASNYKDSNTSNYLNEVEKVTINSLTSQAGLVFKVNGSTSNDEINLFAQSNEMPIETVEACVTDKYGNIIAQPTSKVVTTLTSSQKIVNQTTTKNVTIDASDADGCATVTTFIKPHSDAIANLDQTTYTLSDTITLSSTGYTSDTISAKLWKFGAAVVAENNATALNDGNLSVLNSFKTNAYTAGTVNDANLSILVVLSRDSLARWSDGNASTASFNDINDSALFAAAGDGSGTLRATIETYQFTQGSDWDINNTQTWYSTPLETITNLTVGNSDGNTTQVRFSKAGNVGMKVTLTPSTSTTGTYKSIEIMPYRTDKVAYMLSHLYESSQVAKMDGASNDLNTTINAASAVDGKLSVVSYSSADQFTGAAASYNDVSSIDFSTTNTAGNALGSAYDANLTLNSYAYASAIMAGDGNKTIYTIPSATTGTYLSKYYFVKFSDQYSNPLSSTSISNVVVSTDSGNLSPSKAANESNSSNLGTYSSTSTYDLDYTDVTQAHVAFGYNKVGTDVLNITNDTMGVKATSLTVNIVDATSNVNEITVSAPDYILTNSDTVLTVTAKDQNGNLISATGLKVKISNTNLVTLENNTSSVVKHGDSINDDDTVSGYDLSSTTGIYSIKLHSSNTVGAVTISAENTAGTKVGSKTINIVSSTSDLPVEVENISIESGNTQITKNTNEAFSIKVVDANGNAVANKEVTMTSDNNDVATVPGSVQTDENGMVTFDVTGRSVIGIANITLKADSVTEIITVSVVEAPSMSIDATTATIIAGQQSSIKVSNATSTVTATSSDTAVVSASVVNGDVLITGVAEGSATITITDGTTTSTVAVTVEKGATPAMTPAIVAGWNLLGNASNDSVDPTSFAGAGETTWTYSMDAGWTELTAIAPMQGFWYKARTAMDSGLEFQMTGDGTGEATFTAGEWSLMTPSEAMTLGDIKTAKGATEGWTFMDGAWSSDDATSVEQGRGYWIK